MSKSAQRAQNSKEDSRQTTNDRDIGAVEQPRNIPDKHQRSQAAYHAPTQILEVKSRKLIPMQEKLRYRR